MVLPPDFNTFSRFSLPFKEAFIHYRNQLVTNPLHRIKPPSVKPKPRRLTKS